MKNTRTSERRLSKEKFTGKEVLAQLEKLTGETCPNRDNCIHLDDFLDDTPSAIGYSQFNEILLILGFDSICPELFHYLCEGKANPDANSKLESMDMLRTGVRKFQIMSLTAFGNVKFGFKRFSSEAVLLQDWIDLLTPIDDSRYRNRLTQAIQIKPIKAEDRFYLGYVVAAKLKEKMKADPTNEALISEARKKDDVVDIGIHNQRAYLTSDYLDVYVATSMREKHEFLAVAELTRRLSEHRAIKPLNLRIFDPTLAYCNDRIDKGLAEGLMLKRAKCTLFLAQEVDTLGKDSELASTLAQGKPVIAFVPKGDQADVKQLMKLLKKAYPKSSERDILLDQLRFIAPQLAWTDLRVQKWLIDRGSIDLSTLRKLFSESIRNHYDKRAELLRTGHPLGIQMHLVSGVAIGVLVVRDIGTCAELLRRIILGQYQLEVSEMVSDKNKATHLVLKEELSDSIFRVMTYDKDLTHTFWNSYLK